MSRVTIELKRVKSDPSVQVIEVVGFVDAHTSKEFEEVLDRASASEAARIVIDLHGVDYINSTGISALLACRRTLADTGGRVALARVGGDIGHIMNVMGVVSLFAIFAAVKDAVAYVATGESKQGRVHGAAVFEDRTSAPKRTPLPPRKPDDASVIIVLPVNDRFASILRRRLRAPHGICRVVKDCAEAAELLGRRPPELVVLEDRAAGTEEFLSDLKVKRGGALVSVIKLYANQATAGHDLPFKVWEDDYLIQPFEMMELFLMAEKHLRDVPESRRKGTRTVRFNFASTLEQQASAVSLFGSLLPQAGFYEQDALSFQAAFREAVDNGIKHGNRYHDDQRIEVTCRLSPETLSVRVEDQGVGFDYGYYLNGIDGTDADDKVRERYEQGGRGGLGILLMWRCTDTMRYEGPGNVIWLEKNIPKAAPVAQA